MNYFLTTERLGFRHWRSEDQPLATALWTDPGVMRHMGGPMTAQQAAERLAVEIDRQNKLGMQYWPVFDLENGEHAGCAGLRPYHDRKDLLDVGVHIRPPFWSGRMGEEAARAVLGWAWQHTAVEALVAGHGPHNVNSQALIERLGFRYTHHEPWGPFNVMHPYYRLER